MQLKRRTLLKCFGGSVGLATLSGTTALLSGCTSSPLSSTQSYLHNNVTQNNMTSVFRWTDIMLQNIRNQSIVPPIATRIFAMAHLAGFLAINGIKPEYATPFDIGQGPVQANPEIAYGVAMARAMSEAFQSSFIFDRNQFLSQFPDNDAKDEAIKWGEYAADQVIRRRINDGSEPNKSNFYLGRYPRRQDNLKWAPTGPFYAAEDGPAFGNFARGLLPGWGDQKTWTIPTATQFRAAPFPEENSPEFARMYHKVKALGGEHSSVRTADQSQIAFFWEDGPRGITPPGHWQLLAMKITQSMNYSLIEQARLAALLSLAQADGAISCWDSKYHFDIIRPETAIRQRADVFNNPKINNTGDSDWLSLIPTPGFPAYTSGHSTFDAASARLLALFIGRDDIKFSGQSPDLVNWPKQLTGVTRHWSSLSQAAQEGGDSREYGGIHWEHDNIEGLRIGRNIADYVFNNAFSKVV
ncbi:MAG: hypothetical protein ACJAQ0_000747 [Dasania sp.]|jgi:hypothetical protein